MDRPIDSDFKRRQLVLRIARTAAVAVGIAVALAGARSLIRPSVRRVDLRTARVDLGPIDATISANGTVVPDYEQILSSPTDARVLSVLKRPGARLTAGEPILELDVSESVLALTKVRQNLSLKENQQARTRLDLESTLSSLRSQVEIRKLQLETFEASEARNRKLFGEGLVSEEQLRQSQLDVARTRLEVKQLVESQAIAERSTAMQASALDLETETLRKEREEAEKVLRLATTRADRVGVLTWVVPQAGTAVRRGDVLARIADLSSFRVEAQVSDVHASRLAAGLPAVVLAGERKLSGSVSRVLPTVQNGVITVEIGLDQASDPELRSNLRVDVELVVGHHERALRLKKGVTLGGGSTPEVFVLRGDRAVKSRVRLGVSNAESFEVLEGLAEGDEVVLSTMTDFAHLAEVAVR